MRTAHYGAWQSPITTDVIIEDAVGISSIRRHGEFLYWLESRPQEGGRNVVVQRSSNGEERDFNPSPFNVRSRVHEYGGDAWLLHDDTLYFVNFADQQVYAQSLTDAAPTALTHAPGLRFANGIVDATRHRLIYVVEDHTVSGEADNYLASVDLLTGKLGRLTTGHDFYASPTLSPDGQSLVWLTWDHPNMPWDETTLWRATLDVTLQNEISVAGGHGQSVQQPRFAPNGMLHYISDANGWWNIYNENGCICQQECEFGLAMWSFGFSTYEFLDNEAIACVFQEKNLGRLGIIKGGDLTVLDQPFTVIGSLSVHGHEMTYTASSPTAFTQVIVHNLDDHQQHSIKQTRDLKLDRGYLSTPQTIEFPTAKNETAHGFFYPPQNKDFKAPAGALPPLIVFMHGGPTSATHNSLSLQTQFWTSRGFAIFDINYRGSTGYGRTYRDKLLRQWGIADVEDTVFGARFLTDQHWVDGDKLAIRGGSAGGYTPLAALAFQDIFKAGASHYGIGDLETLARDTHKFESRYLDSIIGPYPEDIETYRARSPIHHTAGLDAAVIFFQGLEDQIVPPNQAQAMVAALKDKGLPVAYVPFEGEQHGFRRSENIKRALDLELYFYGRIFGFTPADDIAPITIDNLD